MRKPRVWTDTMIARAQQMRRDGMTYADIDRRLGLRRGATGAKLNYVAWSEEKRAARRSQIRDWKRRLTREPSAHIVASVQVIPAEVIAERERRKTLERQSLTATFCGDPLPGESALDRRTSPL